MLKEHNSKFAWNICNRYHLIGTTTKDSTQNMKYPDVWNTIVSEVPSHQSGIMAFFVGSDGTLFTDASPDLSANSSSNKNDDFMKVSHRENFKSEIIKKSSHNCICQSVWPSSVTKLTPICQSVWPSSVAKLTPMSWPSISYSTVKCCDPWTYPCSANPHLNPVRPTSKQYFCFCPDQIPVFLSPYPRNPLYPVDMHISISSIINDNIRRNHSVATG